MQADISKIKDEIALKSGLVQNLKNEVSKFMVGQETMVDRILIALFTGGHILLEGVPGLAKTLAVKTMSDAIRATFRRIQFTPDLLPADLIGTLIYNPKEGIFTIRKGPIFANIILADEINRAPAKVQSALLESMQERQVTIGDETFRLPDPFLVMATQNPIEQEGTYPLPEAQVDRFMLKVLVKYPSRSEEKKIVERFAGAPPAPIRPVISPEEILAIRELISRIYIDDKVVDYIIDVVFATRQPKEYKLGDLEPLIEYGASPRASIYLNVAARAQAFLNGRAYVTPQDVKTIGMDVLRHRVIVSYEAEAEEKTSEDVISRIFEEVPVPERAGRPLMDTKELLKKVRAIQIKASRMVNDVLAGEYSSVFKGRGMEFDEVRQYVPGDEIRTIDWNVTARTGVPHVKRFVEERELTVMLLVDLSSSGRFGTVRQLKSEIAAEICALLAFSAIRNQDKVGLILFTGRIEKYVPPKKGKKHVLRVIRELIDFRPTGGETDIGGALEYLTRVNRKRAVVFLISDFIAEAASFEKALKLAGRRHDLIAITIADPREVELPSLGLLELEDIETGETVVIDSRSLRIRDGYRQSGATAVNARRDLFRRIDVDQIAVTTDRPYIDSILRFFKMRERRFR